MRKINVNWLAVTIVSSLVASGGHAGQQRTEKTVEIDPATTAKLETIEARINRLRADIDILDKTQTDIEARLSAKVPPHIHDFYQRRLTETQANKQSLKGNLDDLDRSAITTLVDIYKNSNAN